MKSSCVINTLWLKMLNELMSITTVEKGLWYEFFLAVYTILNDVLLMTSQVQFHIRTIFTIPWVKRKPAPCEWIIL